MKNKVTLFAMVVASTVCGFVNAGEVTAPAPVHDFEVSSNVIISPADNRSQGGSQGHVIISPADNRSQGGSQGHVIISPADNLSADCAGESLLDQVLCAW